MGRTKKSTQTQDKKAQEAATAVAKKVEQPVDTENNGSKKRPASEADFLTLQLIEARSQTAQALDKLITKDNEIFQLRSTVSKLEQQMLVLKNNHALELRGIKKTDQLRISRDETTGAFFWVDEDTSTPTKGT